MATYVLIHGAWHGGWCWKRVLPHLRSAGHEAYAPSLTGSGDRKHLLAPTVGMDTYVNDVLNLVESEELSDVILVGHSAAGAVISKAAESLPDRLRNLVYVDGAILPSGKSLFDVFPKQWVEQMRTSAREQGHGLYMPPEEGMIFSFFASDCNDADRQWIWRRVTPQPIKPYEDKVNLERFRELKPPRTYISCTRSRAGINRTQAEALGMRYFEIDSGHDPMISQPEQLASILLELGR
jgi:pimeloyl-ACP methyl ester carboxylesterase